jgi:hypothetical protein
MTSTTHWRQHREEKISMRKLSYLFMMLSAFCLAVPAFAQGGEASDAKWVAITAGF